MTWTRTLAHAALPLTALLLGAAPGWAQSKPERRDLPPVVRPSKRSDTPGAPESPRERALRQQALDLYKLLRYGRFEAAEALVKRAETEGRVAEVRDALFGLLPAPEDVEAVREQLARLAATEPQRAARLQAFLKAPAPRGGGDEPEAKPDKPAADPEIILPWEEPEPPARPSPKVPKLY